MAFWGQDVFLQHYERNLVQLLPIDHVQASNAINLVQTTAYCLDYFLSSYSTGVMLLDLNFLTLFMLWWWICQDCCIWGQWLNLGAVHHLHNLLCLTHYEPESQLAKIRRRNIWRYPAYTSKCWRNFLASFLSCILSSSRRLFYRVSWPHRNREEQISSCYRSHWTSLVVFISSAFYFW